MDFLELLSSLLFLVKNCLDAEYRYNMSTLRSVSICEKHLDYAILQILHTKGISYLMGDSSSLNEDDGIIDPVQLIQRLAACGYPLVENASVSLFILHPDLAPSVVVALQSSEGDVTENIAVVTLATLYLQQWWFFRLAFALGWFPCFPEAPFVALWEERHLPSPLSGYGLHGLLALQEHQRQRYGVPLNFLDDKRRTKIHKVLLGFGKWTQYSLFECFLSRKDLILLRAKLAEHLVTREDSVRFYPLCASCVSKIETVGGPLPSDDHLFVV